MCTRLWRAPVEADGGELVLCAALDRGIGRILTYVYRHGGAVESGTLVVACRYAVDVDAVGGGVVGIGNLCTRCGCRNLCHDLARAAQLELGDAAELPAVELGRRSLKADLGLESTVLACLYLET